jgi:ATP-dependent DNA helicase RecG
VELLSGRSARKFVLVDDFRVEFRAMDVVELLRRPEGKTLELKRDLSSPKGVLRTVVAFANTAGGTVLLGVSDGTRHVRGIENPLAFEERLANLIADSIEPRLVPDLEVLPWRSTHVVAILVYPSGTRPHHLRGEGPERGTYVRVGSTNRHADPELIAEMRRHARGEGFDEQAIPDLGSEAIDFRAASDLFSPIRRLTRRDLVALRILTKHQGRSVPTVGGFLLFGRDRTTRFPDAWIQVGRFAGQDKARIIDHAEISDLPVKALEKAIAFVQGHLRRGAEIGALRRLDQWDLPPVAIREAVVNAVVHADYAQRGAPIRIALFDDRLEVESPGLLPFGLTVEDLRAGISRLRNRVIGRVFQDLGLIEQWGSGIQRMTSACQEEGLAPPQLEEIGLRFRVTLRTERVGEPLHDPVDQAIIELLTDGKGYTTAAIARHIGRSSRATRTRLARLVERGHVTEVGTGPRDPYRRYFLSKSP